MRTAVLTRLRRPEYTGENRCPACTAVNAVLLLVLVVAASRVSLPLAAFVAVVGTVLIWLRGYFVPFTPRFAPAVAARLPGDVFEHTTPATSDSLGDLGSRTVVDDGGSGEDESGEGEADGGGSENVGGATDGRDAGPDGRATDDGEAVLRALVAAGVAVVEGERVGLAGDFETSWRREMDALTAASGERLAEVARDVTAANDARIERVGSNGSEAAAKTETYLVLSSEDGATAWLRRPVAISEVAAARALGGTDLPAERRERAAHALCSFLDTCPVCGDDVEETSLADCCGHTVPDPETDPPRVLACETCDVVFYRFG